MSRTAVSHVCTLGLALLLPLTAGAQVRVTQHSANRITLTCTKDAKPSTPDKQATGDVADPLNLPGAAPIWELGKPAVPVYRVTLAVPHGAELTLSRNMLGETIVALDREIPPMQPLPSTSGAGNIQRFVKNRRLYALPARYPAKRARIVNRGFVRDVEVVTIEIAPVQYRPKTRQLVVAEGLEITVECMGGGRLLSRALELGQLPVYRAIVANVSAVEAEGAAIEAEQAEAAPANVTPPVPSPDTGADILVIVYDSFLSAIAPLVTHREGQGYDVEVARINADIYTPAGATTAQQRVDALYNYIRDAYATWDPRPSFVLLVGDRAEIEPHEFTGTYGDTGYTDHYFACVSPGVPPTSGGDWYADLAIGRFSASSATDVTNQVNKTLFYEQNPQARTGVAGASGAIDDDFERCEDCKLQLLMEPGGLFAQTNYNGRDGSNEYTFVRAINGTVDKAVTNKDFAPGTGIITVDTHGNSSVWGGLLSISSCTDATMTNRHYFPLAFISACWCGQFDVEDCIQERLQTIQGGTVANSGSATLACGGTSDQLLNIAVQGLLGVNPPYHPTLFEYMISPDIGHVPIVGQAMMIARNEYLAHFGDPNGWNVKECMMQYNLFGDPALMTDFLSPPKITSFEQQGAGVALEWTPIFPRYTVQYRDSMTGAWEPVPGTTWPAKPNTWAGDSITAPSKRFYRVIGNAAQ
ncbi:MAG: hypothetical protein JW889_03910 [Verrucomicrobia bacterium]|nr:hypothetical protein [Verrucomicrobiota bacterium]